MSISYMGHDIYDKLCAVAANLSRYAHVRLELLRCEVAEERECLVDMALHGTLSLLMMFSALELIVLLIVASCWDTVWRLPVIGGMAALFIIATIVQTVMYRRMRSRSSVLFESSINQFKEDSHLLEELR